jgi:hypothetical protein
VSSAEQSCNKELPALNYRKHDVVASMKEAMRVQTCFSANNRHAVNNHLLLLVTTHDATTWFAAAPTKSAQTHVRLRLSTLTKRHVAEHLPLFASPHSFFSLSH